MFVADAGRIGAEIGHGWKQGVSAICESWGYGVVFNEAPIADRSAALRSMDVFGGFALVIVLGAAGSFSVESERHPRWRHHTAELDRMSPESLAVDLRLHFELGLIEPPHVESWDQFAARSSELEGSYFVLTQRCRNALKGCTYHDASRLWSFTARLSEGARQRSIKGWTRAGPIATWMSQCVGLEIALEDVNLGDTRFEYDGISLSWEPHVKVDDAKNEPARVGRIYFAIDTEHERIVVWHIGLHL
jgi:hypothetical protein